MRLERLALSSVYAERVVDGTSFFFSETGAGSWFYVSRRALSEALAQSQNTESRVAGYIAEKLAAISVTEPVGEDDTVEIDMSGTSYEFIFQDIVRRTPSLEHVIIEVSYTASKMIPGAYGGMAVVITPAAIRGKSTRDFIADLLEQDNNVVEGAPSFAVGILAMSDIREALATLLERDESFVGLTQQMISDRMVAAVAVEMAQDPIITEALGTATFAAAVRLATQARDRR